MLVTRQGLRLASIKSAQTVLRSTRMRLKRVAETLTAPSSRQDDTEPAVATQTLVTEQGLRLAAIKTAQTALRLTLMRVADAREIPTALLFPQANTARAEATQMLVTRQALRLASIKSAQTALR